jgi:hypothetical protein
VHSPPKEYQAYYCEDVGPKMEETISKRVNFQSPHSINRLNGREHVVPLQYLMEDNAIKESPKSKSKEYAAGPYTPPIPVHNSNNALSRI